MITMHWLDPGVDTGDIIFKASVPIEPEDTGFVSGHKVTEAAAETFRKVWPLVKAGKSDRIKQSIDEASIFNFDERMAEIDWSQSAFLINNLVKAITKPLFGTWTTLNGQKIMIWKTRLLTGSEETNAKSDVPGTVTAVTVPGFCVQCETGQIEVLEYEFCDSQAEIVGFSLDDILNIVLSSGSVKCIEIKEN
jgi:methionyl-tRNA formyltransferase